MQCLVEQTSRFFGEYISPGNTHRVTKKKKKKKIDNYPKRKKTMSESNE